MLEYFSPTKHLFLGIQMSLSPPCIFIKLIMDFNLLLSLFIFISLPLINMISWDWDCSNISYLLHMCIFFLFLVKYFGLFLFILHTSPFSFFHTCYSFIHYRDFFLFLFFFSSIKSYFSFSSLFHFLSTFSEPFLLFFLFFPSSTIIIFVSMDTNIETYIQNLFLFHKST